MTFYSYLLEPDVCEGIDMFGTFGFEDIRSPNIEHGWLTHESVVQFKIYDNPIHFWRKKYKKTPVRHIWIFSFFNDKHDAYIKLRRFV